MSGMGAGLRLVLLAVACSALNCAAKAQEAEATVLPRGEAVAVYDFYPLAENIEGQPTLTVDDPETDVLTVCFWVRETAPLMASDILSVYAGDKTFKVHLRSSKMLLKATEADDLEVPNFTLEETRWSEFCFTYKMNEFISLTGSNFSVVVNFTQSTMNESLIVNDLEMNTTESDVNATHVLKEIRVGLGPTTNQAFVGAIAMVRMYNREINLTETGNLNSCESASVGNLNFTSVELPGGNLFDSAIKLNMIKKSYICGTLKPLDYQITAIVFGSYDVIKSFCERFGARLPSVRLDTLETVADWFFYSQAKDSDEVYKENIYIERESQTSECHTLEVNKLNRRTYSYRNLTIPCKTELKYAVCIIPTTYKLQSYRGEMKNNPMMPLPTRNVVFFVNKDFATLQYFPCADGFKMCLTYMDEAMEMYKYTTKPPDEFLVGRKSWISDGKPSISVTMTICNHSSFTCNSGGCVPLEKRCNSEADCDDLSDENVSCGTMKPLPSTYWKTLCPSKEPTITLKVMNLGVREVLLNENKITIALSTTVSWQDPRITFMNVFSDEMQALSLDLMHEIWRPTIHLPNGIFTDNLKNEKRDSLLEELFIKTIMPHQIGLYEAAEVTYIGGESVSINYNVIYQHTFTCEFDFFAFPFDIQLCSMVFSLARVIGTPCAPVWNRSNIVLGMKTEISMYEIDELRYTLLDKHNIGILVYIKRLYSSYLLTTFLPCVVLSILGTMTMVFFRLDNFQDRIMVTLSLLIVVASLFSQVVSTIPTSPSSKCVEIFFFYIILRLAVVFLLHTIVDHLIHKQKVMEGDPGATSGFTRIWRKLFRSKKTKKQDDPSGTEEEYKAAHSVNKAGYIIGILCDLTFTVVLMATVMSNANEKKAGFLRGILSPPSE